MFETNYKNTVGLINIFLVFSIFILSFIVLKPFIFSIAWGLILVISTLPIYKKLEKIIPNNPAICSVIMCLAVGLIVLAIIIPISYQVSYEAKVASNYINNIFNNSNTIAITTEKLRKMPIVGNTIAQALEDWSKKPHKEELFKLAVSYQNQILGIIKTAAKQIGVALATYFIAIFSAFFIYKSSKELSSRLKIAAYNLGGTKLVHLLDIVHSTIQATVYGVLLTAFVQGLLAGIGFALVSAPAPVLMGIIVTFLSFIPFGPPFLYVPICLYLMFTEQLWAGIFLLAWCTFLVSMADNILRPLFISQATSMSLLLVLLGILGGIASFGLIGVFIGPVVIAVCQKIWLEFTNASDNLN